jgi:hypothetical protein
MEMQEAEKLFGKTNSKEEISKLFGGKETKEFTQKEFSEIVLSLMVRLVNEFGKQMSEALNSERGD